MPTVNVYVDKRYRNQFHFFLDRAATAMIGCKEIVFRIAADGSMLIRRPDIDSRKIATIWERPDGRGKFGVTLPNTEPASKYELEELDPDTFVLNPIPTTA